MVASRPQEIVIMIYHVFGRKDAAVIDEIDVTGSLIEKELSSVVGQGHVHIEKLTTGLPII